MLKNARIENEPGNRPLSVNKAKTMLLLFLLMVISVCLIGCSTPSQGSPGGKAPAVVTVWYSVDGQAEQELHKQFSRINQERPEVIVKGEKIPSGEFVEQVWNYQAGGEGPDIIIAERDILFALYEKGALSSVLAEDYKAYKSTENIFSFNNRQIAAPWLVDVPLYYYRKDSDQQPIFNIKQLAAKGMTLAAESFNTALFSPYWLAENGGIFTAGSPVLNSAANLNFAQEIQKLNSEQLLLFSGNAKKLFMQNEIKYLMAWASDDLLFQQAKISYGSTVIKAVSGENGRFLVDRCLGIANSSVKTTSALKESIRLVQEELLKAETQAALHKVSGLFPTSTEYYVGAEPTSLDAQIAVALQNALSFEGNSIYWKLIPVQDQAWTNIITGSDAETELNKAQQNALEIHTAAQ